MYIPRFAVEAERRRRKDIAARLILVGDSTVFDCSLGAEASGVKRGMRMSEAIGLCHQSIVLPPDIPYYGRCFEQVLDYLETLSPNVESGELGIAYLSLDGLPVAPEPFAEESIAGLHGALGFMASMGIANGKFAARVAASTTRPGVSKIISPGDEAAFMAPLPVDHLPASDVMRWRLSLLGLTTMGDIACLPLGSFQSQFGSEGKRCWELAQGIDAEPLLPRTREETVIRRLQLPAPAVTVEAILAGLERLVFAAFARTGGRLAGDNGRRGRWVRKVVVRATLDGGGSWELPVPFREALADPRDAWFAVRSAVERRPPERPVEEIEVELVGLSAESGKQASMFDGGRAKLQRQVAEAARQLRAQHGRSLVGKVVEMEPWSRIPERRAALVEFDS